MGTIVDTSKGEGETDESAVMSEVDSEMGDSEERRRSKRQSLNLSLKKMDLETGSAISPTVSESALSLSSDRSCESPQPDGRQPMYFDPKLPTGWTRRVSMRQNTGSARD